jgi:hypothetical protein
MMTNAQSGPSEETMDERDVERRFRAALERARSEWTVADPRLCAARAACETTDAGVIAPLFGAPHLVSHPAGLVTATGRPAPTAAGILLLHYLLHADGTPPAYEWLTYRDLRDGLFYAQAFERRAERPLAEAFGQGDSTDESQGLRAFKAASTTLGGEPFDLADAAFAFAALPRLRMAALLWLGDEEFAARATILFDASAVHCLPVEDLAELGGLLAQRLISARQ